MLDLSEMAISDTNVEKYIHKWWFNPSISAGLRLSLDGYKYMTDTLQIVSYEIEYSEKPFDISSKTMIRLPKVMDCPYYLKIDSILVFSERKAMELALYSGDLNLYVLSKTI